MDAGESIGDWVIDARLGKGGVAEVYRCVREGETAAVKRLRPNPGYDIDQARRRLEREAEILTSLDHPNIVRVRDVRLNADPPWLVMDYVPGRSCSWYVRTGPASARVVLKVAEQLLSAMAHWHASGIAHRDIKPANVLLAPPGRAVVVDFGLALDPSLERLSAQGVRLGTFAYMPPEWVSGDGDSPPASWDVYGAGQLLHELLTGRRAYDPKASVGTLLKEKLAHAHLDPGDEVPEPLRRLVRALTDADCGARPATGQDAYALLQQVQAELEGTT